MVVFLQAVAFAACALLDLLPGTEVDCRFGVPVAVWGAAEPGGGGAPAMCPAPAEEPTPAAQCTATGG